MIRSGWLVVTTLALANMLALIGLVAWLGATDRLSVERARSVGELFGETIAEQRAREEAEAREEELRAEAMEARARVGRPPVGSGERSRLLQESADLVRQQTERTKREVRDLIDTLTRREAQLASERKAFEAERAQFEARRAELAELEGSEQFAKTVKILETVKPDVARSMLGSMLAGGKRDEVLAYLNAVKPRVSAKVVAAFEADEPNVAADLLEGLRVLGLEVEPPEEP